MEKNVTILDEQGMKIGETYPKRAKGLIKKGRAEYVSDFCIRMPSTHVPAVADNISNTMEDMNMSKVIGFDARGFQIDPTCKGNNIANRMFVTDALGNNVEVYEIGDYSSNWTQISYEMPVEKNEDFEFLFAMTGDIDAWQSNNVQCNFIIMPIHEEDSDRDWDNRYQYSLLHRNYLPTMEKLWNGSSIRFYRIPFNTGDASKIRFVFVAFERPYKIFPVKNFEEYSGLEDFVPWNGFGGPFGGSGFKNGGPDWHQPPHGGKWKGQGWYSGPKDFKEAEKVMNNIGAVVSKAVKEALEGIDRFQKETFGKWQDCERQSGHRENKNYYSNRTSDFEKKPADEKGSDLGKRKIYPDELTNILKFLDEDAGVLDFTNCEVESDSNFIPGNAGDSRTVDDFTFLLDNSIVDGDAFFRIMATVGDNCTVNGNESTIGKSGHVPELAGGFGMRSADTNFNFVHSKISGAALISILSKVGASCNVNLTGSFITDYEAIGDLSGFCTSGFDGTVINLDNTVIPSRLYQAIVKCLGDGSKITGEAVIT